MSYVLIVIASFVVVTLLEMLFSIRGKKYMEYVPLSKSVSFWRWVYWSWNYIGARDFMGPDRTPVRHIGVRWYGHVWEKQIEIPMGELRF